MNLDLMKLVARKTSEVVIPEADGYETPRLDKFVIPQVPSGLQKIVFLS